MLDENLCEKVNGSHRLSISHWSLVPPTATRSLSISCSYSFKNKKYLKTYLCINHPEELIVHHPNSSNQQDVSFTVITMSRLISIQKSFFSGAIVKLSENHPGYQHWTNLSQLNHCQSICQIRTKYKEMMHKNTLEIK